MHVSVISVGKLLWPQSRRAVSFVCRPDRRPQWCNWARLQPASLDLDSSRLVSSRVCEPCHWLAGATSFGFSRGLPSFSFPLLPDGHHLAPIGAQQALSNALKCAQSAYTDALTCSQCLTPVSGASFRSFRQLHCILKEFVFVVASRRASSLELAGAWPARKWTLTEFDEVALVVAVVVGR